MDRKLRILFVEDLPTDRELAEWQLRKEEISFSSICVDTQSAFLEALKNYDPDLIISDYSMPEFDGMQALSLTLANRPDIPFIVLTGSINEETAVLCLKAGASDYVLKEKIHRLPFSVRETLKHSQDRKEKQMAERQLRDSEAKFRVIFESANVGKVITSQNKAIVVNQAFAEMLGYTRQELENMDWRDFTPQEDIEHNEKIIAPLYRGEQESVRYQKRYIHKDGSFLWADISVKAQREEDGNPEYFFSTIVDITERNKAEEKLKASEEQYRLLVENQRDMIVKVDAEGRFLYVSPSYCRMFGKKEEELIGEKFAPLVHVEDLPATLRAMETLDKPPHTCYVEQRALTKDGWRWLSWSDTAVLDDDRKIKEIIGLGADITERKQIEIALRESESKFRSLFENNHAIMLILDPVEGEIIDANIAACKYYGYNQVEFASKKISEINTLSVDEIKTEMQNALLEKRNYFNFRHRLANGEIRDVEVYSGPIQHAGRNLLYSIVHDVTDRKEAENQLRKSEEKFRSFFQNNLSVMLLIDPESGMIIDANLAACQFYGYDQGTLLSTRITQINTLQPDEVFAEIAKAIAGEKSSFQFKHRLSNGDIRDVEVNSSPIEHQGKKILYSIVQDVTAKKQADQQLQLNATALNAAANAIVITDNTGAIEWINPAYTQLTGYSLLELIGQNPRILKSGVQDQAFYQQLWDTILSGQVWEGELINKRKDGSLYTENETITPMLDENGNVSHFIAIKEDITQRKQAEEALRESEIRYRSLFEDSPVAIFEEDFSAAKLYIDDLREKGVTDFRDYFFTHPEELSACMSLVKVTDVNQAALKLFGAESKEQLKKQLTIVIPPEDPLLLLNEFVNIANGLTQFELETVNKTLDGRTLFLEIKWAAAPGYAQDLFKVILSIVDITERNLAEEQQRQRLAQMEAMDKITATLRTARTVEDALPILLQETMSFLGLTNGSIWLHQKNTAKLQIAAAVGWQSEIERPDLDPGEGIAGNVFSTGNSIVSSNFTKETLANPAPAERIPEGYGGACIPIQSLDDILGVIFVACAAPRQIQPDETKFLESLARIAGITLQRMTLHEETVSHLNQLKVQRLIDQTIASIFDLGLTLDIICTQVRNHLSADAAGVLLYSPNQMELQYAAGNGFRSAAYQRSRVRLGSGIAGKAALDRQTIFIADITNSDPPFSRIPFISEDHFISYLATPLIAKGEIKGVLEVYFRSDYEFQPSHMEFLDSLGLQTAIAIDNLQLLEDLKQSNLELIQAYDATIEGWSRALDLRDKETEDHTLRVTDMTVQLARTMGVGEEEIMSMRWGALLHDIGKMGIPDHILNKPGPLTDEEWVIMRKHPTYSYEMISPIEYLRSAVDIPYCHHEKWDGSGYPRGLKGDQIPLAGRLFAIIDVWDALSSDRPYRKAWPEEKVIDYIQSQPGTHFDPQIVPVFLEILKKA